MVPLLVPSLRHSSVPLVLSVAEKKSRPLTFVSCRGELLEFPVLMFRTRVVPLLGTIASPQFGTVGAIGGREKSRPSTFVRLLGELLLIVP